MSCCGCLKGYLTESVTTGLLASHKLLRFVPGLFQAADSSGFDHVAIRGASSVDISTLRGPAIAVHGYVH